MCRHLLSLVVTVTTLALVSAPSFAITVNSSNDTITPGDGLCTLREAINNANADLNTTGGDCDPGVGADIITFSTATDGAPITLLGPANDDLNMSGDLDILDDDPLEIIGNGPGTTTIQAGLTTSDGVDRLFEVGMRVPEVLFEGLTLQHGRPDLMTEIGGAILATQPPALQMSIRNCELLLNQASSSGALHFDSPTGALTIENSAFRDNQTTGISGSGGALAFNSSQGTLEILNSEFSRNTATFGAGISFQARDGIATISNTTIDDNSAGEDAGGIRVNAIDGLMTLLSSTISNNSSGRRGGGIHARADGSVLTVVNSTISGNSAAGFGGGIAIGVAERGDTHVVRFAFTTIANNTADSDSNGIGDGGGIAQLSGDVFLTSTIVADNLDLGDEAPNCRGEIANSQGFNLLESLDTCIFTADPSSDIIGEPAGLLPLDDNGGPTRTHALALDSLAINNGVPLCSDPPVNSLDQRGVERDPLCDIGAFESESQGIIPIIPTLNPIGMITLLVLLSCIGGLLFGRPRRY